MGLAGNDRLIGPGGGDALSGGGADQFIFSGRFGHDRITDFDTAQPREVINLSGVDGLHGFADLVAHHLTEQDGSALLTFAGGSVTLEGTAALSLNAGDFLF